MSDGDRSPGWDAKVRTRVVDQFGSKRAFARHLQLDNDGHDMQVWSRIVTHFGGTEEVERYLDGASN